MDKSELRNDHFCFVCGRHNPDGLRLRFDYPEPGRCRAEFVAERKFQGWQGLLHGGIISTLLDEGFAHAAYGPNPDGGTAAVTAEMTVRFKKPARIGNKFSLEGWVAGTERRVIRCQAVLRDAEGEEIASATGKLIKVKSSDFSVTGRKT